MAMMAPMVALLADYGYSGLLFGFEVGIVPILYGGALQGVYMLFLLSCLIMWGVLVRKPIPTGFLTLVPAYGMHFLSALFRVQAWPPSGPLMEAEKLAPAAGFPPFLALAATALLMVLMTALTLARLRRME